MKNPEKHYETPALDNLHGWKLPFQEEKASGPGGTSKEPQSHREGEEGHSLKGESGVPSYCRLHCFLDV